MPVMAILMPGNWHIEIVHPQIMFPDIMMTTARRPAATELKPEMKCIAVTKESCGLQAGLTSMLAYQCAQLAHTCIACYHGEA